MSLPRNLVTNQMLIGSSSDDALNPQPHRSHHQVFRIGGTARSSSDFLQFMVSTRVSFEQVIRWLLVNQGDSAWTFCRLQSLFFWCWRPLT